MNLSAAEGGENAGEGKTEPQRQTDSVAPSEVANEIFGGRTMHTNALSRRRGCSRR